MTWALYTKNINHNKPNMMDIGTVVLKLEANVIHHHMITLANI